MLDKNKRILIIEDDDTTIRILSDAFRSNGFFVYEAIDGKEGIDIALRECPDVILLDIIIPEINGLEVFKRLRKSGCCVDTPIVIMTNLEETDSITEALSLGKCDFIIKTDLSISDIIKRVYTHLGAEK